MKRLIVCGIFIFSALGGMVFIAPAAAKDNCEKCDCIRLPCPKECKPCCGLAEGTIVSKGGYHLMLDNSSEKYTVNSDTKISGGDLTTGTKATIHFRKSGNEKIATQVVIDGTDSMKK